MIVFKITTIRGRPVTKMFDFDVIDDWLRENGITRKNFYRRFTRGEPQKMCGMWAVDLETYVAYYNFEDHADAALFKIFWVDDIAWDKSAPENR